MHRFKTSFLILVIRLFLSACEAFARYKTYTVFTCRLTNAFSVI